MPEPAVGVQRHLHHPEPPRRGVLPGAPGHVAVGPDGIVDQHVLLLHLPGRGDLVEVLRLRQQHRVDHVRHGLVGVGAHDLRGVALPHRDGVGIPEQLVQLAQVVRRQVRVRHAGRIHDLADVLHAGQRAEVDHVEAAAEVAGRPDDVALKEQYVVGQIGPGERFGIVLFFGDRQVRPEERLELPPAPRIARGQHQVGAELPRVFKRLLRPEVPPRGVGPPVPRRIIDDLTAVDVAPPEHQLLKEPAVQHRAVVQPARVDIDAQYARPHGFIPSVSLHMPRYQYTAKAGRMGLIRG